ncbi:hypothetical protein QYE77_01205 [Thermanaerothrix sp. 4228-RoL]|uniref:Glycoside hydrolase family 42 N-terminal domain-containing protein n=1 Tax=Thermanaerothrix solaris TaxID=3058434 RepID=A0ABU3NKW8_9CHLR|nr:hypothetical protein [Thermanaerothrix sp. 4228-RoL]MDT8896868.1 hypothetical protein [Thermanaerothrix sp. 4228-RoL]
MKHWMVLAVIIGLGLGLLLTQPGSAAPGTPGSSDLAIGVHFYPGGPLSDIALQNLADLKPNWVSVSLSWQELQPTPDTRLNFNQLTPLMQLATRENIPVMVSLTQAPSWALSPSGPDPVLTAQFILSLAQRYPGALRAVELFPAANTPEGWGSTPNPDHYASLYREVKRRVQEQVPSLYLVAGGLQPPTPNQISTGALDDLYFLEGLYQQGMAQDMPILSLHLSPLSGDPLKPPSSKAPWGLRHYESIRQMMLSSHHENGVIWITRLSVPDGKINPEDKVYLATEQEIKWLRQALAQIRSQLYIGNVFIYDLNPSQTGLETRSLILGKSERHPLYPLIKWVLQQNSPVGAQLGRPKDQALIKNRDRP